MYSLRTHFIQLKFRLFSSPIARRLQWKNIRPQPTSAPNWRAIKPVGLITQSIKSGHPKDSSSFVIWSCMDHPWDFVHLIDNSKGALTLVNEKGERVRQNWNFNTCVTQGSPLSLTDNVVHYRPSMNILFTWPCPLSFLWHTHHHDHFYLFHFRRQTF